MRICVVGIHIMIGMVACSLSHTKQESIHFEVLQATSQRWISGVPGGGRGTNYRFSIKIKANTSIMFDSVWVAGKIMDLKIDNGSTTSVGAIEFSKGDFVTLNAFDFISNRNKNNRETEEKVSTFPSDSIKAPIKYEGAALLKYIINDTVYYYAVSTIKVLPTEYRQ